MPAAARREAACEAVFRFEIGHEIRYGRSNPAFRCWRR